MFCGSEIATHSEPSSKRVREGGDLLEDVQRHGLGGQRVDADVAELDHREPVLRGDDAGDRLARSEPLFDQRLHDRRVLAFSRRTSNLASGISPVVSSRSTTSSPMSCEIGAGVIGPFGGGPPSPVTG